eukprot:CAMPEP_0198124276 /NCGR_PEP_ID=MMETSP1442-20131203/39574_1 /TAXON_ID= /ORGANISM="Craspedostauros australis, Strain CCMP3328" /LENGTH=50 /DNA_ID=CAMNT_0043783653 /DNA_START=90 /DNA_END=239 /DNA_ORIENTATION=+
MGILGGARRPLVGRRGFLCVLAAFVLIAMSGMANIGSTSKAGLPFALAQE